MLETAHTQVGKAVTKEQSVTCTLNRGFVPDVAGVQAMFSSASCSFNQAVTCLFM